MVPLYLQWLLVQICPAAWAGSVGQFSLYLSLMSMDTACGYLYNQILQLERVVWPELITSFLEVYGYSMCRQLCFQKPLIQLIPAAWAMLRLPFFDVYAYSMWHHYVYSGHCHISVLRPRQIVGPVISLSFLDVYGYSLCHQLCLKQPLTQLIPAAWAMPRLSFFGGYWYSMWHHYVYVGH